MDSRTGRRPSGKGQLTRLPYVDFHPSSEWTQDPSNHILTIHLPGFKREHVMVQVDNSGKLMVKGRRQEKEGRYARLDQSFHVPKDTIIEKITGRFEDESLILNMPKVMPEKEAIQKAPLSEEMREKPVPEDSIEKEKLKTEEKKDDGSIQKKKDTSKSVEEKKDESPKQEEKPKSNEEKKDEDSIQKEKPKCGEEKTEDKDSIQKEKPGSDEEKKEERPHQNNAEHGEPRKKEEEPSKKQKPECFEEAKKRDFAPIREKAKSSVKRKREIEWKEMREGWLDSGWPDSLLETLNKNKKVIAVAIVAFSVGFYVSHKLKSGGR